MPAPTWPLEHARDVYSQEGEDGIVEAILGRLPERDRWCVEFGAWDGVHLSNTRHLLETQGYRAVLIEGSAERTERLRENLRDHPGSIAMNALVGMTPEDGLDVLLAPTPVPRDFDFLSIDIDGNDHHVWRAVTAYRPKLVCIEFNPTVPTEVSFVQPADVEVKQGSSLRAHVELAREKGYQLAAVTYANAFFVVDELFGHLEIDDNSPHTLRTDTSDVTYVWTGFDGTLFVEGGRRLPWHGLPLPVGARQPLPARLRGFPLDFDRRRLALFFGYQAVRYPRATAAKVRRRLRDHGLRSPYQR